MCNNSISNFYKNKRILITGHTGFKGSWMTATLQKMGAIVCGYSLPSGNEYVSDEFYKKLSINVYCSHYGDVADYHSLNNVILNFKPEIIFHLASHSSLYRSMEIPHHILETNMMGVLNVLESARKIGSVKAILVVTSDKAYLNNDQDILYDENSQLGGGDPYSTSKVCQELITQCYEETFLNDVNVGVATARASNVLGPGDDNNSRLFPYLINSFMNNNIPCVRNPYAIRPWQFVLDVVYGYLMLGKKLYECGSEYSGAYNFGPREDGFVKVIEIVNLIGDLFNNSKYAIDKSSCLNIKEKKILKLDSTKSNNRLGWSSVVDFDDAVRMTVDFYQREKSGEIVLELVNEIIINYINKIENQRG